MKLSKEEKKSIDRFNNYFRKCFADESITKEDRLNNVDGVIISCLLDKIKDAIPKSKIRERIKKLQEEIEILEELLEEE